VDVIAREVELRFLLAGAGCVLRTNCSALTEIIERTTETWPGETVCALDVEVAEGDESALGAAHFRGMHHVMVASFGVANVFVFDLRRRVMTARVSETVGNDSEFWHRKLLPIAAGVFGATIGVLPLHSACLARDGDGVLIAGESGAGKSTLAVAMAQRGFDYISDDWTYCTTAEGVLTAHGTAARVKLLPDAGRHFPLLNEYKTHVSMNGEIAFEVRADEAFGARLEMRCRPRMLVFYCRNTEPVGRFTRLDRSVARQYMESNVERLPVELGEAAEVRSALMDSVSGLPCWKFECGGRPDWIARELEHFFEAQRTGWAS
jgi:hypothetical protein